MEAQARHWLTLAEGDNRRLPPFPGGPKIQTKAARLALSKGWIAAGGWRDDDEIARGLSFWIVTPAGAEAATPDPDWDAFAARVAVQAAPTHAAAAAQAMDLFGC